MPRTVEIQVGITVQLPKGRTPSAKMLSEAVRYRIVNGEDPEGISIDFLLWTRKPNGKMHRYEDDDLQEALLKAAGMVDVSRWVFRQVRRS